MYDFTFCTPAHSVLVTGHYHYSKDKAMKAWRNESWGVPGSSGKVVIITQGYTYIFRIMFTERMFSVVCLYPPLYGSLYLPLVSAPFQNALPQIGGILYKEGPSSSVSIIGAVRPWHLQTIFSLLSHTVATLANQPWEVSILNEDLSETLSLDSKSAPSRHHSSLPWSAWIGIWHLPRAHLSYVGP